MRSDEGPLLGIGVPLYVGSPLSDSSGRRQGADRSAQAGVLEAELLSTEERVPLTTLPGESHPDVQRQCEKNGPLGAPPPA